MRTRRGEVDVFFSELTQGSAGGWPEMDEGEGWNEAADFFAAFGGTARAHAHPRPGRPAEDAEAAPGPIDAVVKLPSGKAYFFYGANYVRYDVATDRADAGYPKPIAGSWPGLPASFTSNLGAALMRRDNHKIYFFKGTRHVRFDDAASTTDPDYPRFINGDWLPFPK